MPNKPSLTMKRKLLFVLLIFELLVFALVLRIITIITLEGGRYQELAFEQQTRDRLIAPERGIIYDRNMVKIASNDTLSSISVIHNQITDEAVVARTLSEMLEMDYDTVLKKVQKRVALERIKTKVDKEVADKIRSLGLSGVVIDEDVKRVYPFSSMASQVIGFVGKDNQGIIGLEAKYDNYLKGAAGKILTETDVRGLELSDGMEYRVEPTSGYNLVTSIDVVLQQFAEQTIEKIVVAKEAKRGAIILMDPNNGEILAMANKPDFDLNEPFAINDSELLAAWDSFTAKEQNDYLNQMWRNFSINDSYEPGSTAKILTSVAGIEEGIVTTSSTFVCSGSVTIAGRNIKCWRSPRSHGTETFVQGVQNSCNPVFMAIAMDLGAEKFFKYFKALGFTEKTGIDLAGEASGIYYRVEKIGPVELATMGFGQSYQITPLQLLRMASAAVNGGYMVTPHFGTKIIDGSGNIIESFDYEEKDEAKRVISQQTSDTMREVLESVVAAGTGQRTYIPGYKIGGKTATSQKLPRNSGKYVSSFLTFAPADDPKVIAIVLIDEPKGAYYGGQVAGPVMKELLENVLPYLGVVPQYTEDELKLPEVQTVALPELTGLTILEAKKFLSAEKINYTVIGEGKSITKQFPVAGTVINKSTKILVYTD